MHTICVLIRNGWWRGLPERFPYKWY